MKISVVVPLFYGQRYIDLIIEMMKKNLNSMELENANRFMIELIFVNDSPNEVVQLPAISKIGDLSIFCINNEKNEGIHKTRVNGLCRASGEYVMFLDQDDFIEPNYMIKQIESIKKNDADWSVCNGVYRTNSIIFPDAESIDVLLSEEDYFKKINPIISPGQVLIKREIIPDIWKNEILKGNYCDDAFLWVLLKDRGIELTFVNELLYTHNENGGNTSFSWDNNADALLELKNVMERSQCLSRENSTIFLRALNSEINRQLEFVCLEKIMNQLEQIDIVCEKKIIIYGYGVFGKRLHDILKRNSVNVEFIIDRGYQGSANKERVYRVGDLDEKIVEKYRNDIVCMTLVGEMRETEKVLLDLGFCNIISLKQFCEMVGDE